MSIDVALSEVSRTRRIETIIFAFVVILTRNVSVPLSTVVLSKMASLTFLVDCLAL